MNTAVIDFDSIPDTISKDHFCKICHMSKKTAGRYLGTVIPCGDNGKKTHRYTITKADLIAFLERYPERHKISILPPVCRCSKTAFSSMPLSDNARNVMKGYYSHLLHSCLLIIFFFRCTRLVVSTINNHNIFIVLYI